MRRSSGVRFGALPSQARTLASSIPRRGRAGLDRRASRRGSRPRERQVSRERRVGDLAGASNASALPRPAAPPDQRRLGGSCSSLNGRQDVVGVGRRLDRLDRLARLANPPEQAVGPAGMAAAGNSASKLGAQAGRDDLRLDGGGRCRLLGGAPSRGGRRRGKHAAHVGGTAGPAHSSSSAGLAPSPSVRADRVDHPGRRCRRARAPPSRNRSTSSNQLLAVPWPPPAAGRRTLAPRPAGATGVSGWTGRHSGEPSGAPSRRCRPARGAGAPGSGPEPGELMAAQVVPPEVGPASPPQGVLRHVDTGVGWRRSASVSSSPPSCAPTSAVEDGVERATSRNRRAIAHPARHCQGDLPPGGGRRRRRAATRRKIGRTRQLCRAQGLP